MRLVDWSVCETQSWEQQYLSVVCFVIGDNRQNEKLLLSTEDYGVEVLHPLIAVEESRSRYPFVPYKGTVQYVRTKDLKTC